MERIKYCHKCGTEWDGIRAARTDTCDSCGADIHACLNCRFHDESKTSECTVPNIERVPDKEKANFCEEFEFARRLPRDTNSEDRKKKARNRWNKLFRK